MTRRSGWQIAELKECVELGPSYLPLRCDNGSALLRGVSPPGGIAEVLSHLPPRPTVDRLVSRFFSSMEPGVRMYTYFEGILVESFNAVVQLSCMPRHSRKK